MRRLGLYDTIKIYANKAGAHVSVMGIKAENKAPGHSSERTALLAFIAISLQSNSTAQVVEFQGRCFELVNVVASVETFDGKKVLKVERNLQKLPFDTARLESTVDTSTLNPPLLMVVV